MFGRLVLVGFALLFVQASTLFGQAHFKRFPETVTNDGAYVLGWGLKDDPAGDVSSKTEIPADGAEKIITSGVEFSTYEDVEDYVVEGATGKIIATIPDFTYFAGSEGRENHFNLEVGWSPDNRGGIAVYQGRNATDKVAWINPTNHKAVAIFPQIEKAVRRVAREKKGKRASDDEIEVSNPVFLTPRRFVINVTMGKLSYKHPDIEPYTFKAVFNVKGNLDAPQLELTTARWTSRDEESTVNDADEETQLNKVYRKLADALSPRDRENLKQEQLKWLTTREHITAAEKDEQEFQQLEFTRRRIHELETRTRYR